MGIKHTSRLSQHRKVQLVRGTNTGKVAKNTRLSARKRQKEKGASRVPLAMSWLGSRMGKSFSFALKGVLWVICMSAVSVALLYGYRYLTTNPYFSLKYVEIQGNSRVSSREILESVGLADGANTLAFSISDVEQKLISNPWIEGVSIKRILPDRLVIGIQEREPAFMILLQNGMYYADERGNLIAPVSSVKFTPLPTLEVEKGAEEATNHLPELVRQIRGANLLLDGKNITFVRFSAARGVELFSEDGRLKISIGLEEWSKNLERLAITLQDLHKRKEFRAVTHIKAHGSNVWVQKGT